MSTREQFRVAVKNALIKDGWTISHDPYLAPFLDGRESYEFASERPMGAERANERIVVEVRSCVGDYELDRFAAALGRYELSRYLVRKGGLDCSIWLAIPDLVYMSVLGMDGGRELQADLRLKLVVIDPFREQVWHWIE